MDYHLGFVIRLILLFIPAPIIPIILTPATIYAVYLILTAYSPSISGDSIIINNIGFKFVEACIATYAYVFLWGICMLTKGIKIKTRSKIIIYGFLLIFIFNILRISLIITLAVDYSFYWFNIVHLFFWKFMSGVYVALIWLLFVKIYKIKSIPIYDDLKTLYNKSFRNKK